MSLAKVHSLVRLITLLCSSGGSETNINSLQTSPSFDPLLHEFVWFSSFKDQANQDGGDPSRSINILPYMLPGAVQPLGDLNKDKATVPKVQKIRLRL